MRGFYVIKRSAGRMIFLSGLILSLVLVANAYTVILSGGRQVEIPSRFVVTPATLTYEVTEGIQITIAMAAIDIPATEKANHEPAGSLLARAKLATAQSLVLNDSEVRKPSTGAGRTITNRDLDRLRLRRQESETAYEQKRKQLGLPSIEEQRRLQAAEFDLATSELGQKRVVESESENYWRARAEALRTEMAALDAELNYIRTRIDDGPFVGSLGNSGGTFTSIGSIVGFGSFRAGGNFGPRHGSFRQGGSFGGQGTHRPNVYVAPAYGPQVSGQVSFGGGATRGRVFLNPGTVRQERRLGVSTGVGFFPGVTVFDTGVSGDDFTYERSELITRFNQLAAARAGLNARWRSLEDEARRAGVAPGWLRP